MDDKKISKIAEIKRDRLKRENERIELTKRRNKLEEYRRKFKQEEKEYHAYLSNRGITAAHEIHKEYKGKKEALKKKKELKKQEKRIKVKTITGSVILDKSGAVKHKKPIGNKPKKERRSKREKKPKKEKKYTTPHIISREDVIS